MYDSNAPVNKIKSNKIMNFIKKWKILALCVFVFYFFTLSIKPVEAGFMDWISWLWKSKPTTSKVEAVPQKYYILEIASEGSGKIIIGDGKINCGQGCSKIFLEQSSIELVAKPNPKYFFSEWIGCDSVVDYKCEVNINKNRKVSAKFSVNKNFKSSLSSSASSSLNREKIGSVASMASSISSIFQKSSSLSSKSSSVSKSSMSSVRQYSNQSSLSVSSENMIEKNYLSSCTNINKSGNYILSQDIAIADNIDKPCLDLSNAQTVTINCQGHKIAGNPIFLIENAQQIKFQQCVFDPSHSNPNQQIHPTIKKTKGVTISDSVFNQKKLKEFKIEVWNSSNIYFLNNTVYGEYKQYFSTEALIKNNNFILPQPPQWSPGGLINTLNGSSNQIIDNIIDGGARGYIEEQVGADDGIIISNESNDSVTGNNIKNVFDCGIETDHLIKNSVFEKNVTSNAGLCGIGGWYWNSLIGNIFRNNTADNTQRAFNFYRR